MEQAGYGKHITSTVKNLPYGEIIRTDDIARLLADQFAIPYDKARTATNVKLKRMADKGEIERLQKGIYCHVKQSIFGKVTPNIDEIIVKDLTVRNGVKIGYQTGAALMNRLGLTTLLPREIEVATNGYGLKLPDGCHIKLRKPEERVTDENWKYLQFIDVVRDLPDAHIDAQQPELILCQFVKRQQLDALQLIFTARRLYPAKTVLQLTDLLMKGNGGINESASG